MGKNNKKGLKANVFKVAGAKSLKKTKAKAVNLGLKNARLQTAPIPRSKYKRRPGSRRYIEYTKKQLEECLAAVKSKKLSQRDASEYYNVPRSTIKVKLNKKTCKKPGRPTIFSDEEEDFFAEQIITITEYGFPLTNFDLKLIIGDYLMSQNKIVRQFRDNAPGKDWLKSFRDRYEYVSAGLAHYIKRVRGQISETIIADFVDKVSEVTENVQPENIYSYDEINLCDDPGACNIVCRRDVKYPETSIDVKANFTVMLCGNAAGEAIPPYVIYKSENLCSNWTENGPDGARYNCTKNGWIDIVTFKDWFLSHLLPILKKKKGRKVLIGDHLSSHISIDILAECEKRNITFICLPPNSIHILHPLDIAFFQPLKLIWRELLSHQKNNEFIRKLPPTSLAHVPYLLNKALNALTETEQNLIAAFRSTGIYPTGTQEPSVRLRQDRIANAKKRRLNASSVEYFCDFDLDEAIPSDSKHFQRRKKIIKQEVEEPQILSDCGDLDSEQSSSDYYLVIVDDDDVFLSPIPESDTSRNPLNVTTGDHVIVTRASFSYPGKVLATCEEGAFVNCMKRRESFWRWPVVMNVQVYTWENIICKIDVPELVRRGCYSVPELECIE